MAELFDPMSPDSWRKLRLKSTVTLRDEQTIQEMLDAGDADVSVGRDYFVDSIISVREMSGAAQWLRLELDSVREDDRIWLGVKIAGDELTLSVFFSADGMDPGNRRDMLEREFYWLFEEPKDPDKFRHAELAYANRLQLPVMVGDEEREVDFDKLGGIEHHGKVLFHPPQEGMSEMMATVVEYQTTADVPNSRIQIIEIGRPENEYGGNIEFLQGTDIRTPEVDVLTIG